MLERIIISSLRTIKWYGLLAWIYVCLLVLIQPEAVMRGDPISHHIILNKIRVDTMGVIAFICSSISYFILIAVGDENHDYDI